MELDRLIRLLAEKVVRAGKKAQKELESTDRSEEREKESGTVPDDLPRDEKGKKNPVTDAKKDQLLRDDP